MILAAAKIAVLVWLGAGVVKAGAAEVVSACQSDADHLAGALAALARDTLVPLIVALVVLAAVDWLFQRRQWRRDLRMSRQEWKEDLKRMEGDATIRTARRKAGRNRRNTKGQTA